MWHNKTKIKSDFGQLFGATSYVTVRFDSDSGRVYFSSNDSNFVEAFDSLPKEVLYPAVSLYQKDDRVRFCTMISCGKMRISEKNIIVVNNELRNRLEGGLLLYYQAVSGSILNILNASETASEKTVREGRLSHPFMKTLLPSLVATFLNGSGGVSHTRFVIHLLPILIVLSRRIAKAYESEEDTTLNCSIGPLDGTWMLKCSSGGPSLPAQEYEVTLESSPMRALDPEDKEHEYGRPIHIAGAGRSIIFSLCQFIRFRYHDLIECRYQRQYFWLENLLYGALVKWRFIRNLS